MIADMLKDPNNWSKLLVIWGSTPPGKALQDDAWAYYYAKCPPAGPLTNALTPLLLLPDWMSGMAKKAKRRARQAKWFVAL